MNTMKRVCVLISTYNGQKYLQEQIDSLYAQKSVDLAILARDDGSSDRTPDILRENSKTNDCIEWYQGENLGPAESFLHLISAAPDADYYAFCDQDDVWDDDKLICAVRMLEKIDQSKPALYHSNLRLVDKDLRYMGTAHNKPLSDPAKYMALAEPVATGCTMVVNRQARALLCERLPDRCKMHDEWTYLVISLMGKTVYDFTSHISYRQHDDNVLSIRPGTNALKAMQAKIRRIRTEDWIPRSVNAAELYDKYQDILTETDAGMAKKMAEYKKTVSGRLKLLFEPHIHGSSVVKDLEYRIKVIMGIA